MKPVILVSAGPTREKIDPVRFISNYSTGIFGYEIAKQAKRLGCKVIIISGPTCLKPPDGIRLIRVESALEMARAVGREIKKCDCLIMAAAVSDWRMCLAKKSKIKRGKRGLTLKLVQNPDILGLLGAKKGNKFLVGFALETENVRGNAAKKLRNKNLDMIIANKMGRGINVFGPGRTSILIMDRFGSEKSISSGSKAELARVIVKKVLEKI